MITLFQDQDSTIDKVAAEMRAGWKSVLMQGATGSGKSVMASRLVQRAMTKNKRVLFTVPRRELLRQMSGTFEDFNLPHSFIAADYPYDRAAQAHIASIDTLRTRIGKVMPPELAIIDETHFGSGGLDEIIQWLKFHGCYIIGLSATPWKLNGTGLKCWYDRMVCGPSIRWLINNKRLSEYRAFAPSKVDLSGIRVQAGDYNKTQLAEKMESDRVLIGNGVEYYKKYAMGKLGVTFGVSIRHSQILAEAYRNAGVPAMHIDGKTPDDERRRIAIAFAKREILQLCNVDLLTFGYDLASASGIKGVTIECMNDDAPTKSLAKQMQKWGRMLRMKDEPALLFDRANNLDEHGLPCDEREWTLEDRKTGKGGGERSVPVKSCDKCFYCHHPAPSCPSCGYVYPVQYREIKEVEGELSEVEIKQARKKRGMEEWQCKTLADWVELGKERGYDPGWAFIRFKTMKKRKKE